ncbi:hypothetical protein AGMMS49928_13970 [Spirochaetia bacterium]|nr:hypothetical protein AGMMS49928_13970 [Spirochaetia bacterium]
MAIVDKYIWIDIVPLDGLPKSKIKRLAIKYVSICLRLIYKLSVSNYNYKRSAIKNIIIKWMSRHIPRQKVYGLFLKLITKYSFYESETVVSANDLNTSFYIYPQNIFGNPVKIFFENGLYNAPENYKKFLEIQYGDYMKLPPDEERDHHGFYLN